MSVYRFGAFELDAERLSLHCDGDALSLGPRVVTTLLALVRRAGRPVEKDELLDIVWPEGFVEEANLTQNVYVLRKVLWAHGLVDAIQTVPRCGYRFTARVEELIEPPALKLETRAAFARRRRIVAVLSCLAFLAASFALVASSGHSPTFASTLSDRGERLYQIGLYNWNLRTRDGVRKSFSYFNQVVQVDPLSARGYAGLADANIAMGDYCYGTHRPQVYFTRARAYAQKALLLDPNSAEAHAALGFVAIQEKDALSGVAELRHAIALAPSYAPAHEWYGIALIDRHSSAEGLVQLRIAAELDPLSVGVTAWLAAAALKERRLGDALALSRQALELSPQRADVLTTYYAASGKAALPTPRRLRGHRMAFENAARSE